MSKTSDNTDIDHQLRISEARFKAAIAASEGILWTNDGQGRMVGDQPAWAAFTGQSPEEYAGHGWTAAVHPDDVQPTVKAWRASVAALTPFKFQHRLRRHDGAWRTFSITAVPVLDDDRQLREWVGIHRDVTAEVDAHEQLLRNTRTFQTLVRRNPFGLYVVDSEFRLSEISEGALRVFSSLNNPVGEDFAVILRIIWAEPFASEVIAQFKTTLETGEPYNSRTNMELRADIDAIEAYDWRIERIELPAGSYGVVCYFYDLSHRIELEAELRQAIADKELLGREIEHRVQNSLSIVASLLTVQRAAADDVRIKDALAAAALRVLAIGRVHRQLYKADAVGIVEFGQYLEELCSDIETTLGQDRLIFDVHVEPVETPVDTAVALGIIANELLTNACKYCGRGRRERVTVTLAVAPGALTLTISDTGPGMPVDFAPDRKTGLGFKMIKSLLKQLDGEMALPEAGGEARFEIQVPIRRIAPQ